MVRCRTFAFVTATLACSLTGCLAIYSKRPVEVVVTSIDPGQPVPDLPVSVDYFYAPLAYFGPHVLNVPEEVSGVTDGNGRVVLPIADFEGGRSAYERETTGASS